LKKKTLKKTQTGVGQHKHAPKKKKKLFTEQVKQA
jgi:hypothetical protein